VVSELNCPKKYGKIVFNEKDLCPISGKKYCVNCDVISQHRLDQETWQVKRIKKE